MAGYYYLLKNGESMGLGWYDTPEEVEAIIPGLPKTDDDRFEVGFMIVDYEPGKDPQQDK